MVRRRNPLHVLAAFGLLAGCNAILGVEADYHRGTVTDAGASRNCSTRSDCASGEICLFGVCDHTCRRDGDCPAGWRCLNTDSQGAACVNAEQASCSTAECPAGTTCSARQCRSVCTDSSGCASDQTCVSGACVGTATHELAGTPEAGTGSGGTTGSGGSGGASAANGGAPGSGGAAGRDAGAASGGASGAGGAVGGGGTPNTGGADAGGTDAGDASTTDASASDGSAVISAYNTPCSASGAGACLGHAGAQPAVCNGSTWQPVTKLCGTGTLCDTTPGPNAGTCQLVVAECQGKQPDKLVCRGQDVRMCGPDLVTAPVTVTCTGQACVNGLCQGVCTPGSHRCTGNTPESCSTTGQWVSGSVCPYLCTSGTCTGVCTPGSQRCNGNTPETLRHHRPVGERLRVQFEHERLRPGHIYLQEARRPALRSFVGLPEQRLQHLLSGR